MEKDYELIPYVFKRATRSIAWEHAHKMVQVFKDGTRKEIGVCNYCGIFVPAENGPSGPSGMKKHLEFACLKSPILKKNEIPPSNQPQMTQDVMGKPVSHTFNQKRLERRVVEFVIRDEMPFNVVHGAGFRDMVHDLCPRFKIPNRKKVASLVWDMFLEEKMKIENVIRGQRVSITTDTWRSIQNINYMVVTCHFMDDECILHKRIINFTPIISHKGQDIAHTLESCLDGWGIEKVFTITVDNAAPNDVAVGLMKERFKEIGTLLLDGEYLHLRCNCHIINLVVKDGLMELNPSIEGIRNCVKYIHSSSARLHAFREYASSLKKDKNGNVPLDVSTRWNSTYKMLEGALKFKEVFVKMERNDVPFGSYFKEHVDGKKERAGPPTREDWDKAECFVHFLRHFYEVTLTLSASKTVTSSLFFETLVGIEVHLGEKMDDDSNAIMKSVASKMKEKFNKYFGEFDKVNKLVFVANVLDPRYKLQLIEMSFGDLGCTEEEIGVILNEVKECLYNLYGAYKEDANGIANVEANVTNIVATSVVEEVGCKRVGGSSMVEKLAKMRKANNVSVISNEVERYLEDACETIDGEGFELLSWWRGMKTRYPTLFRIAKDVYAIPSSTVASENAFSLGGRVVDPFRASLTPKTVEELVCTSDWLRGDGFNLYREPRDEEEEWCNLVKDLEDVEKDLEGHISTNTLNLEESNDELEV